MDQANRFSGMSVAKAQFLQHQLSDLSDEEVQAFVDRGRRVLADRKLDRQGKFKYVLDSRLIDGVRWTKEMKPCGNPKCKKCRERHEYHGPVYKSYVWDGERMRAKSHGKNKPEGWDSQETTPAPERERVYPRVESEQPTRQDRREEPKYRRLKEVLEEQRRWIESGRWAEYFVSGRLAQSWAEVFELTEIARAATPYLVDREREMFILDHVGAYLGEASTFMWQDPIWQDQVTLVRGMIDSPSPEETLEAAQRALSKAREVVQQFEECQKSYLALPEHYWDDPDTAPRIEQTRDALAAGLLLVMETSQGWLDLHEEALARLESEIGKAREEVKVLEESISGLAREELDRSKR